MSDAPKGKREGTKTILRLSMIQQSRLVQLMEAWIEPCENNKWTIEYMHQEAQKKLGFPISVASIENVAAQLGMKYARKPRTVPVPPMDPESVKKRVDAMDAKNPVKSKITERIESLEERLSKLELRQVGEQAAQDSEALTTITEQLNARIAALDQFIANGSPELQGDVARLTRLVTKLTDELATLSAQFSRVYTELGYDKLDKAVSTGLKSLASQNGKN